MPNDASHYPLQRDALGSIRLNLQHQLWLASTRSHLHSSIPVKENALIADIGCGTGIWSTSLSSLLPPGAVIEASDISLANAPPAGFWPENVTFRELDIFTDALPEELLERYDVVHIRLFLCVIASGDPIPLLKNLMKLLKPGGWLQWQEYDGSYEVQRVVTNDPGTAAPKLMALNTAIRSPQNNKHVETSRWVSTLHERFGEGGAELVEYERCWTAKEAYTIKQDITFLVVREFIVGMRTKGPEQSKMADALEKMTAEAEEECWATGRGTLIDTPMLTWVARKL
ncbi:uncharacterized protein RCC_03848 [Ramularia collo-cygni]|uniref:Methyltransferase domain-containing protein n=1 Tax=Ramularia collo-cygni TaxID=112498 RepID=A0A2D3UXV3_9PEZI|nr:uncharacterized protein RCC_03848 [Ramularia collo-cygni]CZT18010.1 uncharacterized protein RCC_03848 [Ramularia collo-cygni]